MENRQDLGSILPFLPLKLESSSLVWPNQVIEALRSLSKGPSHSRVDSGDVLFLAISDLRNSLSLSSLYLAPSTADGYALFFDEFLSRAEAAKWFGETLPMMASLLLRFPALLESHYHYADIVVVGFETGLRLLEPQESGIVFLNQELIAALLSCSFFCLFPTSNRGAKHLPAINFDGLFASLYENYSENQEHKIKCIVHYFERICSCLPSGYVSFERKVLPLDHSPPLATYPTAHFWANSAVALSQLEEEIRFMINPELIAGMLFLPSMSDNEAIEIVGTERFSNYAGYAATFRYSGDHVDKKERDSLGRLKTRIVAMDALCRPGSRQYRLDCLLREVNKAFCGFLDQSKCRQCYVFWQSNESCNVRLRNDAGSAANISVTQSSLVEDCEIPLEAERPREQLMNIPREEVHSSEIGVATGNWGCGAFGGDPEVKAIIQWLAASQALRPFISYHTFGAEQLRNLVQVSHWILSHKWTVGDLWNMLVDYCSKRAQGETNLGFFSWLLPSL